MEEELATGLLQANLNLETLQSWIATLPPEMAFLAGVAAVLVVIRLLTGWIWKGFLMLLGIGLVAGTYIQFDPSLEAKVRNLIAGNLDLKELVPDLSEADVEEDDEQESTKPAKRSRRLDQRKNK